MPYVVIDINVFVFHPHRVRQIKRNQRQLAGKQVGQMHAIRNPLLGILKKIVARVALRQIQHTQGAHMHGHLGRFKVQKRGIEAAQMVHLILLSA